MTYYSYWLILQADRNLVLYDKSSGSQVAVWNAGSEVSDRNLKKNIKPTIHNGIDIINKLEVVDFQYIETLEPIDHLTTHTGLIAQDVINVIPNSIKYFENKDYSISGTISGGINLPGNYLINYDRITPYLIKALQEQQIIIDSLVNRISILESKILLK